MAVHSEDNETTEVKMITTKSDDYSQFEKSQLDDGKDGSKELYESQSFTDEQKINNINTGSVFPDSLF